MGRGKSFKISKTVFVKAFQMVKANHGSAGVDRIEIKEYEEKLKDNLYKLWNRMSSGSYFPKPVLGVEIPKKAGGKRLLGIPTVEDRVAQMVVRLYLEPVIEPVFCEDSYGYRPGKSAIDAIRKTRERCWKYDWVLEYDIRGLFDNINHELLMKAVEIHMSEPWIRLYIRRWLTTSFQMPDGKLEARTKGTPQGGVISPVLANLFLHYVFDKWMSKAHPNNPWARYADDGVIHCRTKSEAESLLESLSGRMRDCKLEIHPDKTRIVYCKDANRKGIHENTSFDFLGYAFKERWVKSKRGEHFLSFGAAVSLKSRQRFRDRMREIRRAAKTINLHELARRMNPVIIGWANYFDRFGAHIAKEELFAINLALANWAKGRYKRFKGKRAKSWDFIRRCAQTEPELFVHWRMGLTPATQRARAV